MTRFTPRGCLTAGLSFIVASLVVSLSAQAAPSSRPARPARPQSADDKGKDLGDKPQDPPAAPSKDKTQPAGDAEGFKGNGSATGVVGGGRGAGGAPPTSGPAGTPPPGTPGPGVAPGAGSPPAGAAPPPPPAPTPASHVGRPKPVFPAVKSKWGSVQLFGLLQARFVMPLRGTFSSDYQTYKGGGMAAQQNMSFEVQRIRLLLKGHILSKNFTYLFQGDAAGGAPWLLDVKLGYKIPWVPGLSVSFGRFLPYFSLMMPTLITRLETAEYPIVLTEGGYAPWRQLGIQVQYKLGIGPGTLGAYAGVFNGPANGWTDDNHHKDFFIRTDYTFGQGPVRGFMVGLNAWFGFPKCNYDAGDPASSTCTEKDDLLNKADTDIKAGVMARFLRKLNADSGITAMAEFMLRHYTPWAENRDTWFGYGAWAHFGYRYHLRLLDVEGVGRFDYLAPNNEIDHNYAWRLTAGVNLFFQKIHSHMKINYFYQNNSRNYTGAVSWADVKYGDDPLVMTDWEVKDDLHMFLIQVNTEF